MLVFSMHLLKCSKSDFWLKDTGFLYQFNSSNLKLGHLNTVVQVPSLCR